MNEVGRLACVGVGMMLGAHLAPRARNLIEQADVVFAVVSDPLVELWLQRMHPDVRSLQPYYADGKARQDSYREMVDALINEVRAGHVVCGAFYGHPGVFARVPHDAIAQARREGFRAHMEPGISAEDCLYADLGIDPGDFGCQHYEATQFMIHERRVDATAYLVLWQAGMAGDLHARRTVTSGAYRQLLVGRLAESYPLNHEVIVYEAATLPISAFRAEKVALSALGGVELHPYTTLVVPPARPMRRDSAMVLRLEALDSSAAVVDDLRNQGGKGSAPSTDRS